LVFERQPELNTELNPYTSLVGIRIPDYEFIRQLAIHCDAPLALTSANKSTTKSSLDIRVKLFSVLLSSVGCIYYNSLQGRSEGYVLGGEGGPRSLFADKVGVAWVWFGRGLR
jgi:tRNA A37 threonylcarbamoyladenosine synthetase subunit TsaC/SUA5/YrdC